MSAPARLAFITWIVFDHSVVSKLPMCVKLIVNDSKVPSMEAKNVVCNQPPGL
jgi:hypothetical protein